MDNIDLSRAVWRKSSRSSGDSQCVEVAFAGSSIAMRDSKNPTGPTLVVSHSKWNAFIDGVDDSEFKRP
ncbi:MAG: DUF397 domain-containing protein [Pseudonocardiales bacterium]